jgi:hypothetical protein
VRHIMNRYLLAILSITALAACEHNATSAPTAGPQRLGDIFVPTTTPNAASSTTYMAALTSAATQTGATITTTGYHTACFTFLLTNTTNPVGTLEVDGSIDGTTWHPIVLQANNVSHFIGVTYTALATAAPTIAINDPAGNVKIGLCVEAFPAMRLVYTRTSGGAVATLSAYYSLRAN